MLFELLLDEVGLFVMLKVLCVGLVPLVGRVYVLRFEFRMLLVMLIGVVSVNGDELEFVL